MTVVRGSFVAVRDFVRDHDAAYYGRYRLWFQQVTPWCDDYRALVGVRPGATADLDAAIEVLPDQNWPFQRINRGEQARGWSLPAGDPAQDLLSLEMLSDACYIDMRNFHWALDWLAPHLEDARLFVRSTGDNDDRWLDEYVIAEGCATVVRWLCQAPQYTDALEAHESLLAGRPDDSSYRRFVAFLHRERAGELTPSSSARARRHHQRAEELERGKS